MGRTSLLFLALLSSVLAAATPENVLVVVNNSSGVSRTLSDYYASRRSIPRRNICSITTVESETVSRAVFEQSIRDPIGRCLKQQGLVETVLYIVTTQGVPLRVRGRIGHDGDNASVDSELSLLYLILHGGKYSLEGPYPNPFFGKRDAQFKHPQFPIYLVTRLSAYNLIEAKAMIDKALVAQNTGKYVLDLRGGEDRGGDQWLRNAAILLPRERVVLEETQTVTYDQKRVIGYASWGSNDKNRRRRHLGFEWLPGAIATEFVSTNGRTFKKPPDAWNIGTWADRATWFEGSPQSMTADLISAGATGASGHVDEPYLSYTPRPDYLFPAYYSGRNLAESYYLSMPALSWQNIVIGDPLCTLGYPR